MTIEIFSINFHLFELPFIVFLLGAAIWRLLQEGPAVQLSDAKPVRLFFVLLVVYIFLVQLSIVNAIAPIMVFKSVFKWLEVLLVTRLVFFYVSDQQKFKNIYWFLFWFNFSTSALIYIQVLLGNISLLSYRIFPSYQSILTYALLLPICLKKNRWSIWLLLFLTIVSVLLSLSRGSYLSAIIVTILTFFRFQEEKKKIAALLLVTSGTFLFLFFSNFRHLFARWTLFFSMDLGSNRERLSLLLIGIQTFLEHPFLGVGSLNFPDYIVRTGIPFGFMIERFKIANPHNTFVQVAAEEGVFALVIFCALIYMGFFFLRRHRKNQPLSDVYICGLQNFILVLVIVLFFGFISYQNRINLAVLWGLSLAIFRFQNEQGASKSGFKKE
jgi:hypothetical protein